MGVSKAKRPIPILLPLLFPSSAAFLPSMGCGAPVEATRIELPVVVSHETHRQATTNLGYDVELTGARAALRDLQFAIAGEIHTASVIEQISDLLVPVAYAHPGHFQAGDVTGELLGRFVIDWAREDSPLVGMATLITGTYTSANFTFDRGSEERGLTSNDPLNTHTAILTGRATKDGTETEFTIIVDSPENRQLIGAPFETTLDETTTGQLAMHLHLIDPIEQDTLLDDIDFEALDDDHDGLVVIEPETSAVEEAYNTFRRSFQTHDHFSIHYEETTP